MKIVSQISESFDTIVKNCKELSKRLIIEKIENLDKRLYVYVDKKRFTLIKIVPRTILTTAGIITYRRRYYYDEVEQNYIFILDNQLGIPKNIRMSNELILKIFDLAATMTYSEVGKHLSDEFDLSKFTIWRTIKNIEIESILPPKIRLTKERIHLQIDEKYVNINPSKKRNEKHDDKNKKRYYTSTIFAGREEIGTKGKHKLLNKSYISACNLTDLKTKINQVLKEEYGVDLRYKIFLSGDLAPYIQNFKEDITVCNAKYVPDKFHVIHDLYNIVGKSFNELWLYDDEKLAELVLILKNSDDPNAPKYKNLITKNPTIFMTYLDKNYLGCSQEGQNSHIYSVRFGKYANRFLPSTIEKLAMVREATALGCDITIKHINREIPRKVEIINVEYDFSERDKPYIDLTAMKYDSQKLFRNLIYGSYNI
ncbi:MAG: UPF0236 family protein [bacterium]|nr:UPF0236 family protein [bacterium]